MEPMVIRRAGTTAGAACCGSDIKLHVIIGMEVSLFVTAKGFYMTLIKSNSRSTGQQRDEPITYFISSGFETCPDNEGP